MDETFVLAALSDNYLILAVIGGGVAGLILHYVWGFVATSTRNDLRDEIEQYPVRSGQIIIVATSGLALGYLVEHLFPPIGHTWLRQSFADQQALVPLALICAISYGLRWFLKTPADERDRYWTQLGMVTLMISLAVDKQFWSISNALYLSKSESHQWWRYSMAWIEVVAVLGMYIAILMMIYPWCERWLKGYWWLPWAVVPTVWGLAFKISGTWL